MDFQATAPLLGNLAEFVGAIAVVVTLAFLVVQIFVEEIGSALGEKVIPYDMKFY
jgi:hypothetical protein